MSASHDGLPPAFGTALADRYRVEREVGRGGMASVHLARDLRHDRAVAIKVLHEDLAATLGPERFLAEIKTSAKLQHPHILPLLDSGEAAGLLFYVMPFVEGETLRARLTRETQLPIEDAVLIAREVADALGYAHAHDVVHRDIKPENILLQGGHAVVADFGIALAVGASAAARQTQVGVSLGTPQYMSPEQAAGDRAIDGRTDIFALGVVTYEMLTGEPPFTGPTTPTIIAKVLGADAQRPTLVRPTIPTHVEASVLKALEKVPADRWKSAEDFVAALTTPSTISGAGAAQTGGRSLPRTTWTRSWTIAAAASAGLALALWGRGRDPPVQTDQVYDVSLPVGLNLYEWSGRRLAITRDGTRIAIVATRNDTSALYLRRIDDPSLELVRGTEMTRRRINVNPEFSPDGNWLLFSSPEGLMKVPVSGGRAELLAEDVNGASWGTNGEILLSRGGALVAMRPDGSGVRTVATPDATRGYTRLSWPHMLPDGRHALAVQSVLRNPREQERLRRLVVVSLVDGRVEDLGVAGANPQYAAPGHVVYVADAGTGVSGGGVLVAQPFSMRSRRFTGPAVRLADSVWFGSGGATGTAVSDKGTLVYHTTEFVGDRSLVMVNSRGLEGRVPAPAGKYYRPRISPDGRRVLVELASEGFAYASGPIAVLDVTTGALQLLTTNDEGLGAEWTADGRRVLFLRETRTGVREIVSRAPDMSDSDVVLGQDTTGRFYEIAPESRGAWLAFRTDYWGDILISRSDSIHAARAVVATAANERMVHLSADGRWMAYTSDESGIDEVYVQPAVTAGPRLLVSVGGGQEPVWSARGSTLYYRGPTHIMAAELGGTPPRVRRRDTLFVDRFVRSTRARNWAVFPDGQQYLMVSAPSEPRAYIKMLLGWPQRITASTSAR